MLHRVVRPFPCSFNGLTLVDLEVGDERDFGSMADGLVGEGFIEEIEPKKAPIVAAAVDESPVEAAVEPVSAYETKPAPRRGRPRK